MVGFTVFVLGLVLGSFFNVVINRLPQKQSIIYPPSRCPHCQTRLKFADLIPVLSFIFLRGSCRYCGEKISWQYPVVELMTGVLFVSLYLKFGYTINFFIFLLLVSLLILCSVIDLKHKIIPNKITYPGIVAGLILSLFFNHISFVSALLGILIPGGFLLIIALIYKKGMGMGDVKLVAMIGTFIGWKYTLLGIFLGSLVGSVAGLSLMAAGVFRRGTRIPFGPLLSLGNIIVIFAGELLIDIYWQFIL